MRGKLERPDLRTAGNHRSVNITCSAPHVKRYSQIETGLANGKGLKSLRESLSRGLRVMNWIAAAEFIVALD